MATSIGQHTCDTPGCGKPSTLRCPTCVKLGVEDSYFCNQECFKGFWNKHKQLHKTLKNASVLQNQNGPKLDLYPGYLYTGDLRPFPQSPRREVLDHIGRPDYANHPAGESISENEFRGSTQIKCLDEEDQEHLRIACKLGREVLDEAAKVIGIGVTTDEIDRVVHEACMERECYPSPLNYYQFPKSCCTSVNEVICHGIPDTRPLKDGDIVNVDITVFHRGFHGDLNETFCVGNVDDASKHLIKTTYECLELAIKEVKPGVRYREVGNAIQKHAQKNGFSVVKTYCGHGIHRLFHTVPSVPHYGKNKAVGIMKPGHAFTIEPMINAGTWRDKLWEDKWTAVTIDGRRSAQFEHTLLVTDTGVDVLTARPSGQPWFMDV